MTNETNIKIGQYVIVKCPVYKNGRKFTGHITSVSTDRCMVRIEGNKKSTMFAKAWIELPKKPHFSPFTKALFNL